MKSFLQITVLMLLCFVMLSTTAWGQLTGDYRSNGSGTWGSNTWLKCVTPGTWSDATTTTSASAATTNVYIRSGDKITVAASGKLCNNLYIESGGILVGNAPNPVSAQVYIRVNGDSVVNNGSIGFDPAAPTVYTCLCFETYVTGKTVTFKGSGISKVSRVRNGNNMSNTTAAIDQDFTFTYTGSSGGGGSAWYGNQGTGTGNTLWIKAGRTATFLDNAAISTNSSVDTDGPNTTVLVDGTLLMQGLNSTMSLRPAAGATVSLIVNGTVEVARTFKPTGTTGVASTITVNSGGLLKLGASGLGVAYFNVPAQTVTGLGTFQLLGGTMQIGAPAGLDPTNGPIRTATRLFVDTAQYMFNGTSAQVTGPELPATVWKLSVNNAAGVSLTNTVSVDTTLSLSVGQLIPGSNAITVGAGGTVSRTSGYVVGALKRNIAASDTTLMKFDIGDAFNYAPVGILLTPPVTAGDLTASTTPSDHPNLGTSTIHPSKGVNRYWSFANNGVGFTSYDAVFNYAAGDVDPGADTNTFLVQKYDAGTWTPLTVAARTATSDSITGATSFSDFAIGEQLSYTMSLTATGSGTTTKTPDQSTYAPGTPVSLSAAPAAHYVFSGWTGDVPAGHENDNPLAITMDADKSVVAHYTAITNTITAGVVGNGTITPGGSVAVLEGSDQQFTFGPNTGSHFDSLYVNSIHVDSTTSYTFTNVTAPQTITAYFSLNEHALNVTATNGVVTKVPDQPTYLYGSTVTLTPAGDSGYMFLNWTGDVPSGHENDNPLVLTVDGNKNLTANFNLAGEDQLNLSHVAEAIQYRTIDRMQ